MIQPYKVGFSGTREGMSPPQMTKVIEHLQNLSKSYIQLEGHHGDCVGGDVQFHEAIRILGGINVIHPPLDPKLRAYCNSVYIRAPMPYKARNKAIVQSTVELIAAPKNIRGKGGTWNAISWSKFYKYPCTIILEDGSILPLEEADKILYNRGRN